MEEDVSGDEEEDESGDDEEEENSGEEEEEGAENYQVEDEELASDQEEANDQDDNGQDDEDNDLENYETGDPFSAHFETELEPCVVSLLKEKNKWKVLETCFPELGHLQVQNLNVEPKAVKVKTLMDDEPESKLVHMQRKLNSAIPEARSLLELPIKQKLLSNTPTEL